jgi:cell wall-associated NlpC family hydrolase
MDQIITEARNWVGTKFHHQGRIKQVGCDCLGLIIGVGAALSLRSKTGKLLIDVDIPGYLRRPSGIELKQALALHLDEVAELNPGNILLLNFANNSQHLAIYTGTSIIHADANIKKVVEHLLDEQWHGKLAAKYNFAHFEH